LFFISKLFFTSFVRHKVKSGYISLNKHRDILFEKVTKKYFVFNLRPKAKIHLANYFTGFFQGSGLSLEKTPKLNPETKFQKSPG